MPTPEQLEAARATFGENEPRGIFYRTALELIRLSDTGATDISRAEALATLLQTWNQSYYRFQYNGKFPEAHFVEIDDLLERRASELRDYSERSIGSLEPDEQEAIRSLFADFEDVLGAVGAAKALHLLAPRFFPLWDTDIAASYGCRLQAKGTNDGRYWRLMNLVRNEWIQLSGEESWGPTLLKRIDEFNYCRARKLM